MKLLLLTFRVVPVPIVAPDLRYWNDPPRQAPPQRWAWIIGAIIGLVHGRARREERHDHRLTKLRANFTRFCLDRLGSSKRGSGPPEASGTPTEPLAMVEPSATWRRCYIRAVRELRSNPDQRGHHMLHWASRNDPDDAVRREARIAYSELRRSTALADDVSPRRPVLAALWWLRQAHLLELGVEIDAQGARRTRQVEARRTRWKEDQGST
jgi:hypothetical protein